MLTFLKVKDFAIIDELQAEFGQGFNVITGETGAGKSIIISALSTLMNTRTPAEVVRSNAPQSEVTAHFFYNEEEYLLRRIISSSGRSRSFVNDSPVTANRLAEIGNMLISIYGQNESQVLFNKDSYVGMVDALLSLVKDRDVLAQKVQALRRIEAETERKRSEVNGRGREIELLDFQLAEIERENVKAGEEESIKGRLQILKDAERIGKGLEEIVEGLYDGEGSAHGVLRRSAALLKPFSRIETMEGLRERIESVSFEIEDILAAVKEIEKGLHYDQDEIQRLEDRLHRMHELKSKYGKTYEEMKAYEASANQRLAYLKSISTDLADLDKKSAVLREEVNKLAANLSRRRRQGAGEIEGGVVEELGLLSMKGLQFKIVITERAVIDESGKDDIELLISTNPGEPLRPLRKIASGGELSRIMLAMKKIIGGEEEKTLIFDEVDAGIGGRVAELVGKRLQSLAGTHQVICITHLPQIATYGHHHFLVEKQVGRGKTRTYISRLSAEARVKELARMLGGEIITTKTLEKAEEMLRHAEKGIN
jgi:DNA repair protein RecN (Recombination protein N)